MSDRRHSWPAPIVVISTLGLLALDAALIAWLWQAWTTPVPVAHQAAQPPLLPDMAPATLRDDELPASPGGSILSRPVFSQPRRPFQPPLLQAQPVAAPPQPPAAVAPDIVVDGILLDGSTRKAHLRKRSGPAGEWRLEGETLDGWTITAITASSVTLSLRDRAFTVELYPSARAAP
ncbi:hypothetical protein [Bradyrhizobium brasilense]|uniref:General secretion pathway protein GspN n=1 Tax=Bradyrhizobium brasilense TaxID=1419277 RepID=A0ABY8JNJ5_9BRAD|nr:hypothetical protein [Bradyrhizobium brasilense]WFU66683.1 hypothetical protein QA636_14720 [Bradyrhizobium brasilense]